MAGIGVSRKHSTNTLKYPRGLKIWSLSSYPGWYPGIKAGRYRDTQENTRVSKLVVTAMLGYIKAGRYGQVRVETRVPKLVVLALFR